MTLYSHYKNLPYRFINVVKHSETLEDLVLYETLYDNPTAVYWVRPKSMFFESIEHGGKVQPRFARVDIQIEQSKTIDARQRAMISSIAQKTFDVWNEESFDARLKANASQQIHLSIASIDGQPVGFKIGYALAPDRFYSWLGAVIPQYQRSGVASKLMEAQHEWCIDQGFRSVQTKCLNFNQGMLILNVKNGFLVQDTEITEEGLKLILEKRLIEADL